jgi:hypothetical protein
VTEEKIAEPRLRHDPPEIPGYRIEDRPAIPIKKLNLLSFPLAIPFGVFFYLVGLLLQPGDEVILTFSLWSILILVAIVLLVVPIAHEAVHGIVAKFAGAKPFYGVGQGYAYTSFEEPVTPRQYMIITAAPLVVLSAICIALFPLISGWFLFILAFAVTNAAGAIGDLWILNRIRHLPSNALIYDLADGYAAFVPEGR